VGFPLVPSNRTKSAWITLVVCSELWDNEASGDIGGINGQDNTLVRMIVYQLKTRGCNDCLLQILHGSLLIWAPDKVNVCLG